MGILVGHHIGKAGAMSGLRADASDRRKGLAEGPPKIVVDADEPFRQRSAAHR